MNRANCWMRASRVALVVAVMCVTGCGLNKQEQPTLSGPSGLGVNVTMTASPDQLPRDGSSRSIVTLLARDAQGRPLPNQRFILALGISAPQGAGISQGEVTTDANGQATFAVNAPVAGSIGDITVLATPVSSDAANTSARAILIEAIPRNNAVPQFPVAPAPPFVMTCASTNVNCVTNPDVGEVVSFDASVVTDEGTKCNSCTFIWNFGGDGTASGEFVSHAFRTPGTFVVTLTVTDSGGRSSTAQRTLVVGAPGPPTVTINAPASITAGQQATFSAAAVPALNHRIVSYTWDFGDGTATQTTAATSIQHTFATQGRYFVTVTVRDDLGQSSTGSQNVVVASGLTASFTATKVPSTLQVNFDASTSVSNTGTRITDYTWDFGDGNGTTSSGATPTISKTYGGPGTYTVKLTITDDRGRTAVATPQTITEP